MVGETTIMNQHCLQFPGLWLSGGLSKTTLSKTTIDLSFTLLNGFKMGSRQCRRNSRKMSPFTDPSTKYTSSTLFVLIHEIAQIRLDAVLILKLTGGIPLMP